MPPYMRDTPACVTMAFKWSRCSGKNVLSTSAPDAERQLWPEGYAGWLGFPTAATTVISGSACHGRTNQDVSFASPQPICARNTISLVPRRDRGPPRRTGFFPAGEFGGRSAGAGVRLRIAHFLQCLSLAGEQIGQHDARRACDGAAIQFRSVSSTRPNPNSGGHVCDVEATLGGFRPLHGQVLRDAEEGIRVRCSLGIEIGRAS